MIGLCSNRLKVIPGLNEILPPQNTILVDEFHTNYAFDPIIGVGTALSNYSTLTNKTFNFELQNQNNDSLLVNFNDKNITNGIYANINGYDYNFDFRLLNLSSPTIMFLPVISTKDLNQNIDLNLAPIPNSINFEGTIANYITKLTNTNLNANDLILLTSQNNTNENCVYRISNIVDNDLIVIQDNKLNSILSSDQSKIFIRACISDINSQSYYGLNNSENFIWVEQTDCLQLPECHYNLIRDSEIVNNEIQKSELSLSYNLKIGENIAISISNYGFSSGIYKIKDFDEETVFLDPIFPDKLFVHQFVKIKYDYSTNENCIWVVDYSTISKQEIYGYQKFKFNYYSVNDILSDPSQWAKQVGGASDTILGLTLYNELVANKFLSSSDFFKVGIGLPSWMTNNSILYGLQIQTNYMCEGFI